MSTSLLACHVLLLFAFLFARGSTFYVRRGKVKSEKLVANRKGKAITGQAKRAAAKRDRGDKEIY